MLGACPIFGGKPIFRISPVFRIRPVFEGDAQFDTGRQQLVYLLLDPLLDFVGHRGQASDRGNQLGVVVCFQARDQIVPEPVPRELQAKIARILPVILPEIGQIVQQIAAADCEHGADQRHAVHQFAVSANARQAADARSPDQPVQDRFRLVVRRVASGHVSGTVPGGRFAQECVAGIPSRFLGRRTDPLAC
jgi:hypothetical protein